MSGPVIHIPTKEENDQALDEYFSGLRKLRDEQRLAVAEANLALERLAAVLCGRSGQPYHLRAVLFSLWNGKPASMVEIVNLDWEIRKDLAKVMLAFGAEGCFYNELEAAVRAVHQWEWFLEERLNVKACEEYLKAVRREVETCP